MKNKFLMILLVVQILVVNAFSSESIFKKAIIEQDKLSKTYKEILDDYYFSLDKLLNVDLVTRKDGSPNFIVDTNNNLLSFRLKLTVNDKEYRHWGKNALNKFKSLNLEQGFSKEERPQNFCLAGNVFKLGENEMGVINRMTDIKNFIHCLPHYYILVEYLDKHNDIVDSQYVSIKDFSREGYNFYPLPLFHLNRLNDLPDTVDCGSDETAYYMVTRPNTTIQWLESVTDIRCKILSAEAAQKYRTEIRRDSYDKVVKEYKEHNEKIKQEISNLISNLVQIPERDYMMCKYEVTQALWVSIMNYNPARFKGENQPVELVSFRQCIEFIDKLNARNDIKQSGLVFRLPSAEEWEHACRAGSVGNMGLIQENIEGTVEEMGWSKEFANNRARQVGMKKPNVWGLYDMHGNVWEWTTTKIGNCYKRCGGSWYDGYDGCLATTFHCDNEYYKNDTIGFRLVAEPLGKNLDKPEE